VSATDELRPGAVFELRMVAAYRDGQQTAQARRRRVNPWRGDASTAVERVLALMWGRGYSAAVDVAMAGWAA
jgi:hypothetical protein